MIRVLCKENIEEILEFPENFVDSIYDKPLVELYFSDVSDVPATVLIGQDDVTKEFYITLEDSEHATDFYQSDNETLAEIYENILKESRDGELCF